MNCPHPRDLYGVAVLNTLLVLLCRVNDVLGNTRFCLDYHIYSTPWSQVVFKMAVLTAARSLIYLFTSLSCLEQVNPSSTSTRHESQCPTPQPV